MTDINKNINFRFRAQSELGEINKQMAELIELAKKQDATVKAAGGEWKRYQDAALSAMNAQLSMSKQIDSSQKAALAAQEKMTETIVQQSKAQEAANRSQTALLQEQTKNTQALSNAFSTLQNYIVAAFSFSQIKTFTMEVIDAKSKLDFFKAGLDNIIGSERAVQQVYGDLIRLAKTTPFTIDDLSKTTLSLSAMGVETAKLIPTIENLGNAAAIAGSDKLPRIAKAYTDVMNKGILMKQEINQFSENSIPIYDMLADSMERTRDEVIKLAEDHKITFQDIELAFKVAGAEGGRFYNMAITQSSTLGGRMKNLADDVQLAKARIGDFYEDELSDMIDGFKDWVEILAGSEKALNRTIDGVKTITSAVVTYVAVTKGAAIAETAMSVARGAVTVATNVARIAQGAYALTVATLTGSTEALTASQIRAAAALRASPWAAVTTVVGLAVTAYYAFKTATDEVVSSLSDEEIKIKGQQKLFNDQVKSAMALKEGTDERRIAIEGLIRKYPEYFSGLSAETVNNATLNSILQKVNLSYRDRIDLARQTYQIGELEKKRAEYLKEEEELMKRIQLRSPQLYAQVNGDVNKLMDAINKGGKKFYSELESSGNGFKVFLDNLGKESVFQQTKTISEGLKKIDAEILKATERRTELSQKELKSAIDVENERWQKVSAEMKKGTKEYERAQEDHEKRLRDITGETIKVKMKSLDEEGKAKKSLLELSLENDVKELKSKQQTYENKMKLLDAEEKLAVEQAKRMIESKVAEQERIQSIHLQYSIKRTELMRKEIESRIDYEMKDLKAAEEASKKAIALKEKEAGEFEDLTNYVYGLIDKQRQDDIEKAKTAYDKLLDLAEDFNESIKEAGAMEAAENKKWWETKEGAVRRYWEKVTEQELAGYLAQRERLAAQVQKMEELYGGNSAEYANALGSYMANEKDIQDAQNRLNNFRDQEGQATMNWLNIIIEAWRGAMKQIVEAQHEAYSQAHDAYASVIDVLDDLVDANKEAIDQIYKDTSLTYDEMERKVRDVMNSIAQITREQMKLDDALARSKAALAEFDRGVDEVNQGLDFFSSVVSLDVNGAIDGIIRMVGNLGGAWDRARAKEEAARQEMQVNQYKRQVEAIQMEIDLQTQLLQKKFEMWDQELQKFKEIQDEKERIANEKIAAAKAAEEQASSDQQLRLQNDSNFRAQLMADGERREVAALEAAKQREIQRAQERGASAQEVSDIINSFEALIAEKHKEYADAKGNKDAEISLATKERKAQETDYVNTLEKNLKDEIQRLKDEILAKEREVSANKQAAQKEYADYVKQLQGMQFEAEKQMAIAQIRVEIALLKSKKNLFNKGKINDAIGDLEAAINEIAGVGNPYGYENPSRGSGDGNVVPPRDPSEPGRPGADPDPGTGNSDDPGRGPSRGPRYHGDEWVQTPAGGRFTRDGVLYNLHEGERVVPWINNLELLKKAGKVSNQALVDGFIELHEMKRKAPGLFKNGKLDIASLSVQNGLPSLVTMDYSRMLSMGSPVISLDSDRIVSAIQELGSKPVVNLHVSPRGAMIEEMLGNKRTIYQNNYSKKI